MPQHNAEKKDAASLTDDERMLLARAVYSQTGYLPPRGVNDLSMVRNEVERAVERILAARVIPPG